MAQERDDQTSNPETEHPIGRAILERLRRHMNVECTGFDADPDEDLFTDLYLAEKHGCIPEHLLGEDVMSDIITMYYDLFDAVRKELLERVKPLEPIHILVQPDYEDVTFTVVATGTRVLLVDSTKAWHLWWEDEGKMARDLEGWYHFAERRLLDPPSPRLDLVTSLALETLIEETDRHVPDWETSDPDHARNLRIALQGMRAFLQERGVPLFLQPREEEPDGRT